MKTTIDSKHIALNWIGGAWVDSGAYKDTINPATGEKIGCYANGGLIEAKKAIEVAKKTFKESSWKSDRHLRYKVLNEIADKFEENHEKLVTLLTLENGKIRGEAEFEFSLVAPKLRFYAAQTLSHFGRAMETKAGSYSMVLSEAMGVAGIIAPWNSPIVLMIRSLAPALAAGCTVVIKMPGQSALVNTAISEVLASVKSLPKGVINIFTETGNDGSGLLVSSPDVPTISYTGSTRVGQILMRDGSTHLKRFGFELGGKTPMIVFNDADLTKVVPALQNAITVFAGQFCMTGSRILVQRGIAEQLIKQLGHRLETLKVGPAADPTSEMGPVIDQRSADRIDGVVERAISEGAKVLVRGGKITEANLAKGAFYKPSLLLVEDNKMDIVQEEVFGPVATLQIFDTAEEAVALANDNIYGLAASIWSENIDLPRRVAREIQAGTVWINDWGQVNDEFEEGGYKLSGIGRLNGLAAMEDFLEQKHIYQNVGTL